MKASWLLWVVLRLLFSFNRSYGSYILSSNKTEPVISQSLVLIGRRDDADMTDGIIFSLNGNNQGGCEPISINNGPCGSGLGLGYNITRQSGRIITLEIPAVNEENHKGTWQFKEGTYSVSNELIFTAPFATVVNKSQIIFDYACPTDNDFTVNITIGCAYPHVNISWMLDNDTHKYEASITSEPTGCTTPQVKTIGVHTLNDTSLKGNVSVTVRMKHPSFDNEVFDKLICYATFPGATTTPGSVSILYVWAIILSSLMGLSFGATGVCVILYVVYFKEVRNFWYVMIVLGCILIILAFITIGFLASEDKTDASEYVAAAVMTALSLPCGIAIVIFIAIKIAGGCKTSKLEHGTREAPDGNPDPSHTTDESHSLHAVTGNTATTPRKLPPLTGNKPGETNPRPLPPALGNTSPTATSASEVEANVNTDPLFDTQKQQSAHLPPIDMTNEQPKKKKKKKHKRGDDLEETQKLEAEDESHVQDGQD